MLDYTIKEKLKKPLASCFSRLKFYVKKRMEVVLKKAILQVNFSPPGSPKGFCPGPYWRGEFTASKSLDLNGDVKV